MTKYNVWFERDEEGWWVASVREIRGCHTQGRSIHQARERIREAMGLFLKNAARAELREHVKLPREARQLIGGTKAARARAAAAAARAQDVTKDTVRLLAKGLKMSVRDVGDVVGLSHQRVQQLLE